MSIGNRLPAAFGLALAVVLFLPPTVRAQAGQEAAARVGTENELGPAEKLALQERRIAEQYKHLESVLLRMAELSAATDPRRAALLPKDLTRPCT